MFLSKRSNGIYQIYYVQKNGKRTSISTKTRNKREALSFLIDFSKNLNEIKQKKVENIELIPFSKVFLKYSENNHSWKTTLDFRTTFNFMIKYFGNIDISEISTQKLNEYIQHRIQKTSTYAGRKDLINISSFFNKALQNGYIVDNPCKNIRRIRVPEKQPLFFTQEDLDILVTEIDIPEIRDIVIFAVQTGLRQMEILSLEWNQIDFTNQMLILDNRNYVTKSKKVRNIPLNDKALHIIQNRLQNKTNSFVFLLEGKVIKQDFLVHKFKKYIIKAGLNPELNFHALRHTFASWLVQKGESIYKISKLLGHADIKTTEIYAHLNSDDLRSTVQKLN